MHVAIHLAVRKEYGSVIKMLNQDFVPHVDNIEGIYFEGDSFETWGEPCEHDDTVEDWHAIVNCEVDDRPIGPETQRDIHTQLKDVIDFITPWVNIKQAVVTLQQDWSVNLTGISFGLNNIKPPRYLSEGWDFDMEGGKVVMKGMW